MPTWWPTLIPQRGCLVGAEGPVVRENLQASRVQVIYRQHKHAYPISIMVGDTAMKSVPELDSKLSNKFVGPFLVVD